MIKHDFMVGNDLGFFEVVYNVQRLIIDIDKYTYMYVHNAYIYTHIRDCEESRPFWNVCSKQSSAAKCPEPTASRT